MLRKCWLSNRPFNKEKNIIMKKIFNILMLSAILFAGVCVSNNASAQPPATPATGGNNPGDQPMGGHAPIGGGVLFLLAMGAGYAIKKVYYNNNDVQL
jgi:hypothetical protein